ncbi:AMP-binding protein [Devosia sp. 2618]|uniref:AMP-binding protein n=1 Tax=Devosia sp. 2618 TaxID=3156454 RepID=UPI00339381D6
MSTPYQLFQAAAQDRPDQTFLLFPEAAKLDYAVGGLAITYGQMADQVAAQREKYRAAGFGVGHVMALSLDNRPEFFVHFFALNALGVAMLPLNPDLRADELSFQFSIAEPDAALVLERYAAVVGEAGLAPERIFGPDDVVPNATAPATLFEGTDADPCALLFTSGTTGKPKCCVLSNFYFAELARWYVEDGCPDMEPGKETILTPLPMFHMNALGCSALGAVILRSTLVPLDRFSASRWWASVAQSRATVVHYLGVMPAILLKLAPSENDRGHNVRFAFGAGVDPMHQQAFEERFAIPLVEAWAMTETGGGATTSTAGGERHIAQRCIGYPHPAMEFRIVADDGADAVAGEPGELLVRAKGEDHRRGFFTEYLKDAKSTDEAWAGGWFHTGDVVRSGPDGAFFFVDRKKNIVRRSGENIAVVEVEGVLQNLAQVAAVAVAPVPDDIRGEEVMAMVVLAEGNGAGAQIAQDIALASSDRLAYHKVPGYIAFVTKLPVTATQKLQRGEIKALAKSLLADVGTIDLRDYKGQLRKLTAKV